ncbi:hypothetical protein DUI87_13188 [Hirundo rustica rustica]|uniref:Uncharacterized protein n=1 Tax=Hirundo rustica rustica TaxID=333673 RepID=A0A3M0KBC6_HIRRU|nr:hypothetical protein DUI87_13188 [Hirundo rustica rustica]
MFRRQKSDLQIEGWAEFSSETLTPIAFNCPVLKEHENDLDVCSIAVAQETPSFVGPMEPMPAGYKMDPVLAKAKTISDSGITYGIA